MDTKSYLETVRDALKSIFKKKVLRLRNKNWKADSRAAFIQSKLFVKNIKPFIMIFGWYTFIGYLIVSYLANDYSYKVLLFTFGIYILYERLKDDYMDIIELRKVTTGDKK